MDLATQVKDVDIIHLLSTRYNVSVKKAGRLFSCACPLPGHNEHNPSFFVYPNTNSFNCFGQCDCGGDVIALVMRMESVGFIEACEILAEVGGIVLDKGQKIDPVLYDVNEVTESIFHKSLTKQNKTDEATRAFKYLVSRGVTEEMMLHFKVGYAPMGSAYSNYMTTSRGYTFEQLQAAGLTGTSDYGQFDSFQGRIMFPIQDKRGRTVGFGGRATDPSAKAKYKNTRETDVFNKGKLLYNWHRAVISAKEAGVIYVVEGYLDVISMYQHGIKNVVGKLGMHITKSHAKMLTQLGVTVVIIPDAETGAYDSLVNRVGFLATNFPNGIKILTLPDGNDPDDFVRESGKDGFILGDSVGRADLFEWAMTYSLGKYDFDTLAGQSAWAKWVKTILLPMNVLSKEYYAGVASKLSGLSVAAIMDGIAEAVLPPTPPEVAQEMTHGEFLLAMCVLYPNLLEQLNESDFIGSAESNLYARIVSGLSEDDSAELLSKLEKQYPGIKEDSFAGSLKVYRGKRRSFEIKHISTAVDYSTNGTVKSMVKRADKWRTSE